MEEKEYFVLGDKKFAIPSDKVDGFISKYPDAQKAKFYDNVNGKKYYIPLDKVDAFEEKFALKKNEKNQLQEKDITEDSSTVAEPLQESGGETEQDGGLENPMALYGKYQQKNTALSELNNQIDYQESLDSPDQESIAELKRKRNELSSEVKTTASELVSPISNRELPKYYNEDGEIKDEYVTTNIYDFKVPDLDKIQEDADRLFTDPALKRKYQKDIENSLQFSIDVPKEKLQEKVNEVYKNEFGQPLDEAIEKSQVDAFNNTYGGKLKKELSGVNYKIKEVQDLYSEELSKINTDATVKAEQLGNEYKQAIAEIQQKPVASEEDRKRLQREADNLYSNYSKSVDEIISSSVDIENQYNAKINQYAQEQYENYNNKVKEFTDKFQKEYKISPEIAKNLQSASNKAASELLKESNKKKEENIKLSGGYSGGSYYGRLATSTLSSLGGVLSGWATAFGGTGEFGDKVQQYFQPAVSPIKSFKDLTLYSLTESGGNLMGSMFPSVLAGITSGVLTRNAGLTTRIVATAAAQLATETVDIAARQYKEALERTGSTAEAENAASEAIDGQIRLSPIYLLSGLPFIGAFKKISNPVLRVGTGAAVEYVTETIQETAQGLMEQQIIKSGTVEGSFAVGTEEERERILDALNENAANLVPSIITGGVGAINKETENILKTNPDIGMQQLGDVIYKKGKAAANLQISQLYSQGMIDKETFEFLGTQIEGFDVDNSKEYNALKFKRDQVAMSIDKESDPVKQKILKDTVKAYDTMLEMSILGENVSMPQIEANGITYTVVTNNPIEWLKSREEQSKSEEKTTVEQYGDKKEVTLKKDFEAKKADIDRRRQEDLSILDAKQAESEKTGKIPTDENGNAIRIKEEKQKINSKYDAELAELAALESNNVDNQSQVEDVNRRRQEELENRAKDIPVKYEQFKDINGNDITKVTYKDGSSDAFFTESGQEASKDGNLEGLIETNQKPYKTESAKERGKGKLENKINAEYDAEYVDAVKKGEMTKEQAMQALEEVGRKDSEAYLELKALEQQSTTGKKEVILDDKEVDISDEQFDKALEIIEPTASERGELTIEQVEDVFNALGDGAGDVIDISKKQDAVSLYNDLTDKKKEYNAKRNESEPMREQGGKKEAEGTVDSDMSKVNETKLQDGEKEKIAQEIGKSRKVRAKNIRGLLDVMAGIFGLSKPQAESAAVVGDVIIGNAAKRAGVSKDEMYQIIAFQKAQKAPDGSLKQDAPLTFKSTAKEGIGKIQQTSATPEQWVKQISEKGGKGTSQELEWIGLQDYLNEWKKENNAKSVPKEVVEQYINDNQIEIIEVTKGGVGNFRTRFGDLVPSEIKSKIEYIKNNKPNLTIEINRKGTWNIYDRTNSPIPILKEVASESVAKDIISNPSKYEKSEPTKYSQYQLEGGENYREVLLTLPNNKKSDQKYYKKEHFDEANILAHLRLNERTLPNGERVLFIEEVQSDWAQEGKKKGFGDRGKITESDIEIISDEKRYYDSELEGYEHRVEFRVKGFDGTDRVSYNDGNPNEKNITDLKKRLVFDYNKELLGEDRTPDMPYKKTDQWVGMALRRVMQMASQEGFDRIAWVTGEQSAERYDLSKQVDRVEVADMLDGNRSVYISMKDNSDIQLFVDPKTGKILQSTDKGIDGKMLEDVVGKEISNKILNLNTEKESVISSEGLKVGGEGMKAFYNSILPKVAGKEAKRFDKKAKVEVVEINTKEETADITKKSVAYDNYGSHPFDFANDQDALDYIQKRINESGAKVERRGNEFWEYGVTDEPMFTLYPSTQKNILSKQLSIPITPEMRMNLNSAVPLFQGAQGAMTAADGNYVVYALTNPNVSTPLHELAHIYEHYLTDTERKAIQKWAGTKEWTTETSEKFARGFEKYLAEGKAPTLALQKYFDNFKQWLIEIYNGIVGSEIDIELNEEMRSIYDQMLKEEVTSKQKESSGAKKPQEKQETAKTATAEQKSKQSPQDVKKETEGLTEKEVAKQGVEEIVQAYKNKLKEAKQKANEKISDEKQKARILKGNIKAAKDIITGIIEESIPKGVMLGKSILRDVANALTPKQIERVADRIERNVENIQRRNKINDIKSKQAKVKKKLPNFTNQQESVKEILNVDLTQVKDLGILQEIENELDAALESDVAKLDPKRMSELLDKLEQKSQPESKTTSKRKVSEKIQSLKESDKNSDKKIKELQSLNRALDKTLGLNQINQDDYNDALSIIEKELELLEKDRQEDTKKLNKDSVERLSKLDEKPFSKVQKDEIKRLRNVAGKSTKYRDALKLNEIIDELELGYIPVKQMDEYRNDAISYQESNNLSTQINKRTGLDSIKNKLASLLGLQREGTLRGSKKNKSFSDALNILELNNISSWNDLFGLGRKEGISNFLSPLFTNMIATTSENVRHIMNNYFTIKYPISPFKKGLTKDKEIALIMMRKQGDWEVTEGMDTDYWGELLSEKNIEEAKKQYNGDKSDISLKKLIKIYESLPKRKGKLDYEGYFENLKGVEKRINDFLTKLAEDNAPLQEIANQRNGKEFVKRDSRYYLTDIVLRDSGGALEDGLGGLSFVLSNGVSLDAGVGETRTAGKKVKPILLDLDRIVNKQTTETIRDYNLSSNLKAIRKTFIRTIPQLTEPNARALMSMFGQALSIRMQAEYGIRAADSSRNFIGKLLGAARAYFLAGFKRVGVEFVAEVFRSLPATRKRYVPNAVKAIIQARAMGIKLHKELLARTGSPYLKKAYLESSAADSQVTADTKRTIFGRIADFVKAGSDGMMGVSSNVVFPQVWLPEFLYQFKQLTGKDFDVKNYSDAYFNKNEKDIRSAAIIADTNAERIFGGSTRAARRTKAKWLGTPVIGLIQSIQGKFTGDYSFGNKYKYVDPYTNFGMLNTFLSNFAGIEAYNTFTRGLKGILYGENVSRWKAGQYLLFGIISGTLYTYLRDEIMTILFGKGEDEEDERETEEKFIDAMINNIIFLSVGQYGQSAQLALRTFVGIYEDRLDDEQKKRFRRLSQDRFNVYPLNFGYGSITRAYDNLIPFLGETISTISQSKDVIMNAKEIEDGITLSEEEMMTLKAIELTNNMLKLAFTVKGTQIPMQRDIDRVLKALDKIESGKEITRSEYELLETYNFIPIIDEIYENADIKE